jgi:hypothetical protein
VSIINNYINIKQEMKGNPDHLQVVNTSHIPHS